jgi:hypothetical protein
MGPMLTDGEAGELDRWPEVTEVSYGGFAAWRQTHFDVEAQRMESSAGPARPTNPRHTLRVPRTVDLTEKALAVSDALRREATVSP